MNRKTLLIAGAGVVALLALLGWAFAPRPVEVEVATARVGPFEVTIDEDARTRLRERYVVSAPLIELGDTAQMEIVAELLTTDALLIGPGSTVHIERWGGPGVLQGHVRRIEPAAFTKVSALGVEEQRVNVLIDIGSPPTEWAALGDGYRVSVRIVTRSEASVLRVPVSAVFPLPLSDTARNAADDGSSGPDYAVFVHEGGRAHLRRITLAGRNGSLAWIAKGMAPGAQVIVYPPASVADGVRVKLRGV